MKQISYLLLFILLGSGMQSLNAQENAIKTNLLSLTTGTFSVDYERKLGPRITGDLRLNYFFAGGVLSNGFNAVAEQADGETYRYDTSVEGVKGFFVNPGFRFYPKEAFRGFYLEPNIRFFRYSFSVPYAFESDIDPSITHVESAPSYLQFLGGGLNLGGQKVFDSGFTMDFFAGFGYSIGKLHVESQDGTSLSDAQLLDVKQEIDDAIAEGTTGNAEFGDSFVVNNLSATVEGDKVSAEFAGIPWPILRLGFSLGYAF